MNIDEIKEIIKVLEKTDIVEFELEKSGVRVRIRKGPEEWAVSNGSHEKRASRPAIADQVFPQKEAAAEKEEAVSAGQKLIKAPIVGTFYRSASPDAESYVEVGTVVKKGQIVCIIEAMKLMNEIESDVDGKVVKILTENAHPVEFGEPLFAIEPQ
jgi:acetyl-CoA carboxylase biotin carboxyl carrier protein